MSLSSQAQAVSWFFIYLMDHQRYGPLSNANGNTTERAFVFSQAVKRKEIVIIKARQQDEDFHAFCICRSNTPVFGCVLAVGIVPAASKKAQIIRVKLKVAKRDHLKEALCICGS
jgi:hypothetical protein